MNLSDLLDMGEKLEDISDGMLELYLSKHFPQTRVLNLTLTTEEPELELSPTVMAALKEAQKDDFVL